jgi:hypothetical protein
MSDSIDMKTLKRNGLADWKQKSSPLSKDLREMKGDIRELRRDLNDHRSNTELHGTKKNRKVS